MYVVFNLSSLNSFLCGHFRKLDHLFLKSVDKDPDGKGTIADWTTILTSAMTFPTEHAASKYVADIWGSSFSEETFSIMFVHPNGMEHAEKNCKIIAQRER